MLIVITNTYAEYKMFMDRHFPYFKGMFPEKSFPNLRPDNENNFRSFERGTPYIWGTHAAISPWVGLRFTEMRIVDNTPKTHSFIF